MATHWIRNTEIKNTPIGLLVLLDTSFLLTSIKQRFDYESAFQRHFHKRIRIATIDLVVYELQRLARVGRWNTRGLARVALELVTRGTIEIIDTQLAFPGTDTSLVAFALQARNQVLIATVDSDLRELLRLNGLTVISPRSRSGLVVSLGNRFRPP